MKSINVHDRRTWFFIFSFACFFLAAEVIAQVTWSAKERQQIKSFALSNLPSQNEVAYRRSRVSFKPQAVAFGRLLFFDTRMSKDQDMACSTCHPPHQAYADSRNVMVPGLGPRNVPTLIGAAWQNFFFWDGRKDSLWSQATGPITATNEHNMSPSMVAAFIEKKYKRDYERVFGPLPVWQIDAAGRPQSGIKPTLTILANVGKAIAAFVASIRIPKSKFDLFVEQIASGLPDEKTILNECEGQGLKVFLGKGFCANCHNGPLLTDNFFHNTGVPAHGPQDYFQGRKGAVARLKKDVFNCQGPYSDQRNCPHTESMRENRYLYGAFKTPTLRSINRTAPYMHNGSLETLEAVIGFYDRAPDGPTGYSELIDLRLTEKDLKHLVCFLKTL